MLHNNTINFFLKLVLFLFGALLIFMLCFGYLLPRLVKNSGDTKIERWNDFYSKPINAHAVILGSSRAHRGINPQILTDSIGFEFHNMAFQGMSLSNYSRFLNDYLLNNNPPQYVIISLDILALAFRDRLAGDYYLIPGIDNRSELLNQIYQFRYIKYCRAYGYFYYKNEFFSIIEYPNLASYSGYEPIDKTWTTEHIKQNEQQNGEEYFPEDKRYISKIDRIQSESYFRALSDVVQKNNIEKLFLVLTPYYSESWETVSNQTELLLFVDSMAEKYDFKTINFLYSDISKNSNYYYDPIHLNKNGSEVFSRAIADSLHLLIE